MRRVRDHQDAGRRSTPHLSFRYAKCIVAHPSVGLRPEQAAPQLQSGGKRKLSCEGSEPLPSRRARDPASSAAPVGRAQKG